MLKFLSAGSFFLRSWQILRFFANRGHFFQNPGKFSAFLFDLPGSFFSEIPSKTQNFRALRAQNGVIFFSKSHKKPNFFLALRALTNPCFFYHPGSFFLKIFSKVLSGVIFFEKHFKSFARGHFFLNIF